MYTSYELYTIALWHLSGPFIFRLSCVYMVQVEERVVMFEITVFYTDKRFQNVDIMKVLKWIVPFLF